MINIAYPSQVSLNTWSNNEISLVFTFLLRDLDPQFSSCVYKQGISGKKHVPKVYPKTILFALSFDSSLFYLKFPDCSQNQEA